jgi:hypothetical protein
MNKDLDIKDYTNLNFVEKPIPLYDNTTPIIFIDFNNKSSTESIESTNGNIVQIFRFFDSFLGTLKRIVKTVDYDYFWVASSTCNYESFDFQFKPSPWEDEMLHVFPTESQREGGTFFINRKHAIKQFEKIKRLQDYLSIRYHRMDHPIEGFEFPLIPVMDTVLHTARTTKFTEPYVLMSAARRPNEVCSEWTQEQYPSLWSKEDRKIHVNETKNMFLVPKDLAALPSDATQAYDYKNIKFHKTNPVDSEKTPIAFISYGEPHADQNYAKLCKKVNPNIRFTDQDYRIVIHVEDVHGMVDAIKAAANRFSDGDSHFYAVFPRLEIVDDFNFDFQVDYLANRKNYIFKAYNPILDYAYGHGGIVLYDAEWVRSVSPEDLKTDFTTSHEVEVVDQISCINRVHTPWDAWRTGVRESFKLAELDNIESRYRLKLWMTKDLTDLGNYSVSGAKYGYDLFINGEDPATTINDWNWLSDRFYELPAL